MEKGSESVVNWFKYNDMFAGPEKLQALILKKSKKEIVPKIKEL